MDRYQSFSIALPDADGAEAARRQVEPSSNLRINHPSAHPWILAKVHEEHVVTHGEGRIRFALIGPSSATAEKLAPLARRTQNLREVPDVAQKFRQLNFVSLAMMAMTAISGIFYPLASLPSALQWLGQVFPLYWLGLGMRSALLPDGEGAAEPLSSWPLGATALVLVVWTVAGTVGAVAVLRRAARLRAGTRIDHRS